MNFLAPQGPVYQAGTLSGNPVAVAAGKATLKVLEGGHIYPQLEERGDRLQRSIESSLDRYGLEGAVNRVGSMFTVFFGVDRVTNAEEARQCDRDRFARFFHGMMARGIYFPPSPFEAAFISLAHSAADIEKTVQCFEDWARSDGRG